MYFDFFNESKTCPMVSRAMEQISTLLGLTAKERLAYEFLAKGPLDISTETNLDRLQPLHFLFSRQARLPNSRVDLSVARASQAPQHTNKKSWLFLCCGLCALFLTHTHGMDWHFCCFFSDLMANILVVALGSPESTHVYNRVFHLSKLGSKYCPGSGMWKRRNGWAHHHVC